MIGVIDRLIRKLGYARTAPTIISAVPVLIEVTILEKDLFLREHKHYPFRLADGDTVQVSDSSGKLFTLKLKPLTDIPLFLTVEPAEP